MRTDLGMAIQKIGVEQVGHDLAPLKDLCDASLDVHGELVPEGRDKDIGT
jgi:hypothetical protein